MADNLDLKGTVDISVDRAVRNLRELDAAVLTAWDTLQNSHPKDQLTENLEAMSDAVLRFREQVTELQKLSGKQLEPLFEANKLGLVSDPEFAKALSHVAAEHKRYQDEISSYAKQANADRIRVDSDARRQELQSLKAAILERSRAEQQAANARNEYARQANAQYLAIQDKARTEELSQLKSAILEREQVERDHAEALKMNKAFNEAQYNQLANTRYALQDLAFTWTAVSAATLGAATAAVKLGGDYEKSFRSVQRTTLTMGDAARDLKNELVDLTTTIPQQFDEIANIATLGAQMDVPTENLEKFTETVATFSATTDVSVEKTAMSMGRLAQLTETPIDSIDRLAASVYHVGINSVATEGQILAIAEQIAVSGNLAGLANHEIIGLSAALASLGVQPEAARGAIMRIFNHIRMGVDEGGDALERFASVSGTSAEEFAKAWLDRPQEAFNMFVQGLERVAREGGSVSGVLKEMGMSNVRDLRVLELLADNTEVYADALVDAAQAYGENTALADGYAIEMDNLNDQLTLLINSFKAMLAEIGEIPGLKELVKTLLSVSEAFRTVLKNPIAGAFAKITIAVTGLLGVYAAFQAMSVRATASTMGLIQSMRGMERSAGIVRPGILGLLDSLILLSREQRRIAAETKIASAALREQNAAAREASAGLNTVGKSGKTAAAGVGAATSAVRVFGKATVIIAAVSIAVSGLFKAIEAISDAMKSTTDRVDDFIGSSGSLRDAMIADGQAMGEGSAVIATWTRSVEDSGVAAESVAASLDIAKDGQLRLREATEETTEAVGKQVLAFGDQAKQLIVKSINEGIMESDFSDLQNTLFKAFDAQKYGALLFDDIAKGTDKATAHLDTYRDGLFAVDSALSQILGTTEEVGMDTVETWRGIKETISEIPPEIRDTLNPEVREFLELVSSTPVSGLVGGEYSQKILELQSLFNDTRMDAFDLGQMLNEIFSIGGQEIDAYARQVALANTVSDSFAEGIGLMGDAFEEGEESAEGLSSAIKTMADEMLGGFSAVASMEEALENLGASLYENGTDFDVYSAEGRANLKALEAAVNAMAVNAGDDIAAFTNDLIGMLGALEAQGVDTSEMLAFVQGHLLDLIAPKYGINLSTAAARQNLINLLQDGQAVKQLMADLGALEANIRSASASGASYDVIRPMLETRNAIKNQLDAVNEVTSAIANAKDASTEWGGVSNAINRGLTNAYNKAAGAAKRAGGAGKKAGKDAAKAAKEAQKEVRTLADYVSDLSSTMNRAFEFRFGVQTSKDATSDIFATIRKNAEDAREAVKKALQDIMDANAKLQGLKADKTILQYQLTVAEEYGDTLRATQIRAELAEKNAEIAKTEKDKADAQKAAKAAQDATNKTLVGNSDIARKNRADILSLVQSYQKQIEALADSGLSSKELQRETERLRQDFIKQTTQLGYSRSEVDKYAKSFSDMSTIIKNVPRNITVNANVSPAQRAINEFLAKKEKSKTLTSSVSNPSKANLNKVKKAVQSGLGGVKYRPTLQNPTKAQTKSFGNAFVKGIRTAIAGIRFALKLPIIGKTVANFMGFRSGGFTGRGNLDELAGMVHRGEYVVPAQYVNQATGLPDLNALGQSLGMNTYNSSVSSVTNTTTVAVVELSARDRQLLSRIGDVQINLDNRVLATATNKSNLNTSRRGVG